MTTSSTVPKTTGRLGLIEVTAEPLDLAAQLASVQDLTTGALASFLGVVRNHDHDVGVTALRYEAHPEAVNLLTRVAAEIATLPGVQGVSVTHRYGDLLPGDIALIAVVATSHRGDAFDACRALVEQVKAEIPVWKRQTYTNGSHDWVNCA